MSMRTSSVRSHLRAHMRCAPALFVFAAALAPNATAQQMNNIALVCEDPICDLFPFIPDAQKFDNVDDAVMFALMEPDVDTVQILEGTWSFGDIDIDSELTIEGIGHPANVIVQNGGAGPTFTIIASDVVLEGLTITGGVGSGVAIEMGSDVVINRCYVHSNSVDGIVVNNDATAIIVNTSCASHSGGAGIRINTTVGQTEIAHCTFAFNDKGLVVDTGGTVRIRNSLFEQNTTSGIDQISGTVSGGTSYYFSNGTDYDGSATPLPGDMIAPNSGPNLADPAPLWAGQVLPLDPSTMMPSAVISAAEMSGAGDPVFDFVKLDLDGDLRDDAPDAEVGADEGGVGFPGTAALIFVQFFPEPIGELAVGELFVVLQFSGYSGGNLISFEDTSTFESPLSDKVVLWPQSLVFDIGNENVPPQTSYNTAAVGDYAIPLNVSRVVDNYWIGTNAVPIDSELRDAPNAGLVKPGHAYSGAQIYLDGVAELIIHINQSRFTNTQMRVDDADRQPVIDTHPPEVWIDPALTGLKPGTGLNDRLITSAGNDADTALFISGDPRVGAPVSTPAAYPFNALWTFTAFEEMEDPPDGNEPSVFYNMGADFGTAPGSNLNHSVTVSFVDAPPLDSTGEPIVAIIPSGFQPELYTDFTATPITVAQLTGTATNGYLMPRWNLSEGQNKLQQSETLGIPLVINTTFVDPGNLVVGSGSDTFPGLEATWDFINLGYTVANNDSDPFRYSVQFVGIDAAFNIASGDDLLDPLNVWWLVRTRTQLSPYMNTEVDTPSFTWELKRGADTNLENTTEDARPVFAYRFFRSINPQDRNGPYAPLAGSAFGLSTTTVLRDDGWSPAYTYNLGLAFQWFESNGFTTIAGLVDNWLLLAVVNIDEAGNVEQLPWNPLTPDVSGPGNITLLSGGTELYTLQAAAGVNWQRFLIRGPGSSLDTGDLNGSVTATFWHEFVGGTGDQADGIISLGETFFPQANIVPLPPVNQFNPFDAVNPGFTHRTNGQFDVGYAAPTPIAAGTDRYGFIWAIERDGFTVISGVEGVAVPFFSNTGASRITYLPASVTLVPADPLSYLGDGERLRAVNYVFKAATWWSPAGNVPPSDATFEQPPSNAYVIDTTPVNYPFTVAPDAQDYIENKAGPDNQPVKVIESN